MQHHHNPPSGLGPALACALIAQIASVLLAAVLAAQVPGGYRVRSWVFLTALLWSLAGTILLLVRTAGGLARRSAQPESGAARDQANAIGLRRIALWLVSAWVWPVLVGWRRSPSEDQPLR